jgi:hypothetical protein
MPESSDAQNHRDIVSLRDYIESRLDAIRSTMQATDKTVEARLLAMNELREQINAERGHYLPRSEHEAIHKSLDEDIRSLRESRSELAGKASMAQLYATWIFASVGLVISLLSLLKNLM